MQAALSSMLVAAQAASPQLTALEASYDQPEPDACAVSPSRQEVDISPVQATPSMAGGNGTSFRYADQMSNTDVPRVIKLALFLEATALTQWTSGYKGPLVVW